MHDSVYLKTYKMTFKNMECKKMQSVNNIKLMCMIFTMSLILSTFIYIKNYGRYVKDMRIPWPVNESNSHVKNTVNYIVFIAHKLIVKVYGSI